MTTGLILFLDPHHVSCHVDAHVYELFNLLFVPRECCRAAYTKPTQFTHELGHLPMNPVKLYRLTSHLADPRMGVCENLTTDLSQLHEIVKMTPYPVNLGHTLYLTPACSRSSCSICMVCRISFAKRENKQENYHI